MNISKNQIRLLAISNTFSWTFSFLFMFIISTSCAQQVCSTDDKNFVINGSIGTSINNFVLNQTDAKFSGSILVIDSGTEILGKTYKYLKRNKPCDVVAGESFWISSVSKQFCAAAILLLKDMGKLNLHDPISNIFSDIPDDKKDITIHQLLTHTSGMSALYKADGISDRDLALFSLLKEDLVHLPGTQYSYSGQGYNLLAIIVEYISGKSYEQFLQEKFFIPLKLTNTGMSGDQGAWNILSIAKKGKGAKRKLKDNPQFWDINYGYKGATGILTNPRDLYKWHLSLKNNTVLSENSTNLMFTPHVLKRGKIYYGYGWNIFEESKNGNVIVHSGDDDFIGHSATIRYYSDKNRLIIVLSNAGYDKDGAPAARTIASSIIDLIFR